MREKGTFKMNFGIFNSGKIYLKIRATFEAQTFYCCVFVPLVLVTGVTV